MWKLKDSVAGLFGLNASGGNADVMCTFAENGSTREEILYNLQYCIESKKAKNNKFGPRVRFQVMAQLLYGLMYTAMGGYFVFVTDYQEKAVLYMFNKETNSIDAYNMTILQMSHVIRYKCGRNVVVPKEVKELLLKMGSVYHFFIHHVNPEFLIEELEENNASTNFKVREQNLQQLSKSINYQLGEKSMNCISISEDLIELINQNNPPGSLAWKQEIFELMLMSFPSS